MATDKTSAQKAFQRFLESDSRYCLIEGTHQYEKHGIAVQGLLRRYPGGTLLSSIVPQRVLLRINTLDMASEYVSQALGKPLRGVSVGRNREVKVGGVSLHVDSFNRRSWGSTPPAVACAVLYPVAHMSAREAQDCLRDLEHRGAKRIIFCTCDDPRAMDLEWIFSLSPVRITYHAKDERPDYHQRVLEWSKPESYYVENT